MAQIKGITNLVYAAVMFGLAIYEYFFPSFYNCKAPYNPVSMSISLSLAIEFTLIFFLVNNIMKKTSGVLSAIFGILLILETSLMLSIML